MKKELSEYLKTIFTGVTPKTIQEVNRKKIDLNLKVVSVHINEELQKYLDSSETISYYYCLVIAMKVIGEKVNIAMEEPEALIVIGSVLAEVTNWYNERVEETQSAVPKEIVEILEGMRKAGMSPGSCIIVGNPFK